jgi:hypothetical protein
MIPETEIAWAAGFFDGEGNTCVGRALMISIGQVNRSNLERFNEATGELGSISGPYDRGTKPIFAYRAFSDKAFAVFRSIAPYVGEEKLDQFLRYAVQFCFRTVRNGGGSLHCRRGHLIAEVGRYRDGDCMKCRMDRRAGVALPPILPAPTAFDLRLHDIQEYTDDFIRVHPDCKTASAAVAWTFGLTPAKYRPRLET